MKGLRTNAPAVSPIVGLYLSGLRAGDSRRTVRTRLRQVAEFFGYPDEHAAPWDTLDYEHVQTVLNWCRERQLAPATINHYRAVLLGVARTAFLRGELDELRYRRIQAVKPDAGSRLPAGRNIDVDEFLALVASCDSSALGRRDRAVLEVLHSTGLRAHELIGLDIEDYNAREGSLRVLGKGSKERRVYLTSAARKALTALLAALEDDVGPVFRGANKQRRLKPTRLSPRSLAHVIQTRCRRSGVKALTTHDFRRTHVGDLLAAGVDLVAVQRLLGHGDPATTARYDRRHEETLQKAVEALER